MFRNRTGARNLVSNVRRRSGVAPFTPPPPPPPDPTEDQGVVTGVVTDSLTGAPIASVTVTLGSLTTLTDGSGTYAFQDLDPGLYQLDAQISGYTPSSQQVTVVADTTTTANISLVAIVVDPPPPPPPPPVVTFQNVQRANSVPKGDLYKIWFDLDPSLMAQVTEPYFEYLSAYPTEYASAVGATIYLELTQTGFAPGPVVPQPGAQRIDCFYDELTVPEWLNIPIPVIGGRDHILMSGISKWQGRAAFHTEGTWYGRLVAEGLWGQKVGPTMTIQVDPNPNYKGMVQVDPDDPRSFRLSGTGEWLPAIGVSHGIGPSYENPSQNAALFQAYADNGIQVIRQWFTVTGYAGDVWGYLWRPTIIPPTNEQIIGVWHRDHGFYGNYISYIARPNNPRGPFSLWLNCDRRVFSDGRTHGFNPIAVYGLNNPKPAVERDQVYEFEAYVQMGAFEGPAVAGYPVGFAVLEGTNQSKIYNPSVPQDQWIDPRNTDVTVWAASWAGAGWTVTGPDALGNYTIKAQRNVGAKDFLTFFGFSLVNCQNTSGALADGTLNAGHARIHWAMLRKVISPGVYGPNVLYQWDFNVQKRIVPRSAFVIDTMLAQLKSVGMYAQFVIDDKNKFYTFYEVNGSPRTLGGGVAEGMYGAGDEGLAPNGWLTTQGFLRKQLWRQVHARWDYTSSVFAWEVQNEGHPTTAHYNMQNDFHRYMRYQVIGLNEGDESQSYRTHPVLTSFFGQSPITAEPNARESFEKQTLHQYNGTTAGPYAASPQLRDDARWADSWYNTVLRNAQRGALTAGGFGKPVGFDEVGYVWPDGSTDRIASGEDKGAFLLLELLASLHTGGIHAWYWTGAPVANHLYKTTAPTHDYRPLIASHAAFLADIPRNNGLYVDGTPTLSDTALEAVGEKDVVNERAHGAIRNKTYTHISYLKSLGLSVPAGTFPTYVPAAMGGTATWTGLVSGRTYDVTFEQWQADVTELTPVTASGVADGSGNLVINLATTINAAAVAVRYKLGVGVPSNNLTVPATTDWSMAGANVKRTSYTTGLTFGARNEECARPFVDYISQIAQMLVIEIDPDEWRVFQATAGGLHCLDGNDTTMLAHVWTYPTVHPLGHTATYHPTTRTLYVGGTDRYLHAIDVDTGLNADSNYWPFRAGAAIMTNPLILDLNGQPVVYFGCRDGYLYCVWGHGSPLEGTLRWRYKAGGQVNWCPTYDEVNGLIHFAADDAKAYAIDAVTGQHVWVSQQVLPSQGFRWMWGVKHDDGFIIHARNNFRNNEFFEGSAALFPSPTGTPVAAVPGTAMSVDLATGHPRYDFRTSSVGQSVPQYHNSTGKLRRAHFFINAATGVEQFWDWLGNGAVDPAPFTPVGKTCANHPVVVDEDGIIYAHTTNQNTGNVIAGALAVGWRMGDHFWLMVESTGPTNTGESANGRKPHDEPRALSGADKIIATKYCGDRMVATFNAAAANATFPNPDIARQLRFLGDGLPPMSRTTGPNSGPATPRTTVFDTDYFREMPKFWNHPTATAVWNWHGFEHSDVIGPTLAKDRIWVAMSNAIMPYAVVAPGPTVGTNAPVRTPIPHVSVGAVQPTTIGLPELQARLDDQIDRITAQAGGMRSGWFGVGASWDNFADNYRPDFLDLWHRPGWDNLRVLLLARPYVNASRQAAIDTYINNELKPGSVGATPPTVGRVNPVQYRHLGFTAGADRFGYQFSGGGQTHGILAGANIEPENFYGVWKYLQQYGNPTLNNSVYQTIKNFNVQVNNNVSTPATGPGTRHRTMDHSRWIAYAHAYGGLWALAGSQTDAKWNAGGTGSVQTVYNACLTEKLNWPIDTIWPGDQGNALFSYFRIIHTWAYFADLTEEMALWQKTNNLANCQAIFDYEVSRKPYWFIVHNAEVEQENGTYPYPVSHALFQCAAQILGWTRSQLTAVLDEPACSFGDMYYLENLIRCIQAP